MKRQYKKMKCYNMEKDNILYAKQRKAIRAIWSGVY